MLKKGTSQILQIGDPAQRVLAAMVYQAFLDYDYSPTHKEEAGEFLASGGGEWKPWLDYDISAMFEEYKRRKGEDTKRAGDTNHS